jgi:hypothetical protein
VLASACLAEERAEGVVATTDGLVGGHLTIGLDAMFQAVQLPACIADLNSSLTYVDRQTLTLQQSMAMWFMSKFSRYLPTTLGQNLDVTHWRI